MSNKSSVEWLFYKLWNTPKDKLNWHSILKQAKEMHKEEIVVAWKKGDAVHDKVAKEFGEKYYNETFKNEL